jgi:hypothetical protein
MTIVPLVEATGAGWACACDASIRPDKRNIAERDIDFSWVLPRLYCRVNRNDTVFSTSINY